MLTSLSSKRVGMDWPGQPSMTVRLTHTGDSVTRNPSRASGWATSAIGGVARLPAKTLDSAGNAARSISPGI